MAEGDTPDHLEALEMAHDEYRSLTADIESIGRDHLEEFANLVIDLDRLVEQFEDRATGTGDFGGYIAFREQVTSLVENAPDDVPHREELERIAETADKRRLSEGDFETIRHTLSDIRPTSRLIDREEEARLAYRDARREAISHRNEIDDRIDELKELRALADVDFDAPIEDIQEPIEGYNAAVRSAFQAYIQQTPASEVLDLFSLTDTYPLVSMEAPPDRLCDYLEELPEALTVPELLEYADYSRSKLDHYVDDPEALKTAVSADRTYLERLSANPFEIEWPPPSASVLTWTVRELISITGRFADEECLAALRNVRACVRERDRFDQLREVALARTRLDDAERERIQSGELEDEREQLISQRDRLEAALEEYPSPDD